MSPWDGASRWINTALLVVVGFIGFDTLFRLLEANERNVIVGFTRSVATVLLSPFEGMFDDQDYLLTALIAILGYALVAGILLAVIRSLQASRRRRVRRGSGAPVGNHMAAARAQEIPPPPPLGAPAPEEDGWTRPRPPGPGHADGMAGADEPSQANRRRAQAHDTAELPTARPAGSNERQAGDKDPFAGEGRRGGSEDAERTWPGHRRA